MVQGATLFQPYGENGSRCEETIGRSSGGSPRFPLVPARETLPFQYSFALPHRGTNQDPRKTCTHKPIKPGGDGMTNPWPAMFGTKERHQLPL